MAEFGQVQPRQGAVAHHVLAADEEPAQVGAAAAPVPLVVQS